MHIGLKPKVISLKLFLDMVLSSYADIGRALRGCFLGGFLYVSFRFVSKRNELCEQRQQRQRQRRLKNDFTFNLRISREFRLIIINIPERCTKASKFETEILKLGRRNSRSFENAEFGYFTLLFCKERQRNEQRFMTHAYTAIIVAVAV